MQPMLLTEKRRPENHEWRVESPTKWAIEDSVTRNESVSAIPRVPIPAGANPTRSVIRSVVTVTHVGARCIRAGFRQIRGSQAAPAIKIALLIRIFIEFFRFQGSFLIEIDLVSSVDGYRMISVEHFGFAAENADLLLCSVKIVQTGFHELRGHAVFRDPKIIL